MKNFPKESILGSLKNIRGEILKITGQVGDFAADLLKEEPVSSSKPEINVKNLGFGWILRLIEEDFSGSRPRFTSTATRQIQGYQIETLLGEGETRHLSLVDLHNKVKEKGWGA